MEKAKTIIELLQYYGLLIIIGLPTVYLEIKLLKWLFG